MAKNYRDVNYFETFPEKSTKIFDDLDAYLDYCRIELCAFNPADLYRKDSVNYQNFLHSKRPRRPYLGKNPRWDNNGRRNEQNFSR
jgi:hypothetical protein